MCQSRRTLGSIQHGRQNHLPARQRGQSQRVRRSDSHGDRELRPRDRHPSCGPHRNRDVMALSCLIRPSKITASSGTCEPPHWWQWTGQSTGSAFPALIPPASLALFLTTPRAAASASFQPDGILPVGNTTGPPPTCSLPASGPPTEPPKITDFMPMGDSKQRDACPLVRRVQAVRGSVAFGWNASRRLTTAAIRTASS